MIIEKRKGFSLVEIILYLGLFGLIFLLVIQFALSTSEFNQRNAISIEIEKDLILLNEHVTESFKKATGVNLVASVLDNDLGTLALTNSGDDFIYLISNNKISYRQGNGTVFDFSLSDYIVNRLRFELIQNPGGTQNIGVTINIQLTSGKKSDITRQLVFNKYFK